MSVRMVLGGAAVRSARTGRAAIKHLLDDDAQHDDDDDDDDDHHHHINEHRTQCDDEVIASETEDLGDDAALCDGEITGLTEYHNEGHGARALHSVLESLISQHGDESFMHAADDEESVEGDHDEQEEEPPVLGIEHWSDSALEEDLKFPLGAFTSGFAYPAPKNRKASSNTVWNALQNAFVRTDLHPPVNEPKARVPNGCYWAASIANINKNETQTRILVGAGLAFAQSLFNLIISEHDRHTRLFNFALLCIRCVVFRVFIYAIFPHRSSITTLFRLLPQHCRHST